MPSENEPEAEPIPGAASAGSTLAPGPAGDPKPVEEIEPRVEELRVAMALNGGVSLAVWMGGCTVELDRARRAHKGVERGARRVYDDLCECFGRRLVIDIVSGSSAGGINGALLGAAIAKNRCLEPDFVREKWLQLGDLEQLLQDRGEQKPTSLMKGDTFHKALEEAFEELLDGKVGPVAELVPPLVPSVDVTMTDVIGVERRFRDAWGSELIAREHRPRFSFREKVHFSAEALAVAARTSASFPGAFDPFWVEGNPRILAGLARPTYGIDGGLLDNAPIRAALDLIPSQTSSALVKRYVCYVNGDPTAIAAETSPQKPTLRDVASYAVNLPRTAPLVDHLYAIRDAVERPRWSGIAQEQLLRMPLHSLNEAADALFAAYRERRTVQSLEELFEEPGDVAAVRELLEKTGGNLPWIPGKSRPVGEQWEWGVRPAQRIVHLLLDLLRPTMAKECDLEARARLLSIRAQLYEALETLADVRDHVTREESENNPSRFDEEAALERLQKAVTKAEAQAPKAREAAEKAIEDFFTGLSPERRSSETGRALFGETLETKAAVTHFLERALSIEVVRRAFSDEADIESAQRLHFTQLTPGAPTPIFTKSPLDQRSPATAALKLTGVGLGHFAGFYRRSWRANDFMWGRLDAAARIVDLLLDARLEEDDFTANAENEPRTANDPDGGKRCEELSRRLAKALLSTRLGANGRELLEETLANVAANAGSMTEEGRDEGNPECEETGGDLQTRVAQAIEAELRDASGKGASRLPFTRAAFQRAAQLEILAEELGEIEAESTKDSELGSAAKPLALDSRKKKEQEDGDKQTALWTKLEAVREIYRKGDSLPKRLNDPAEAVSNLGLRTITHAAFVTLSALRTAGLPMAKYLGLARPPLLGVAGTVAQKRLPRLTVAAGFWAAAVYLTSRLVTAQSDGKLEFSSIWSLPTLVALVAALGALGVIAVPGLRAWRRVQSGRNLLYTFVLALAAGGLAAGLAAINGFDLQHILFTPGAETPPEEALLGVLGALGLVSLIPLLPKRLRPIGKRLDKVTREGTGMCLVLVAAFAVLGAYAGQSLVHSLDEELWKAVASGTALLAAPVFALCLVAIWLPRRKTGEQAGAKTPRQTGAAEPT